jgi:hypothetical protein
LAYDEKTLTPMMQRSPTTTEKDFRFGQSWSNLQKNHELEVAKREVGWTIEEEAEPRAA